MDYTDLYNSIKTKIADLTKVPKNTQYMLGVEHFTLPSKAFPEGGDEKFKTEMEREPNNPMVKLSLKYNVLPSEIKNVLTNFDLQPSLLSDSDKALRKKYLNIILSGINDEVSTLKDKIQDDINNGNEKSSLLLTNYDGMVNTVIRIVKLLIGEIDGPVICPTCPAQLVCPSAVQTTCPTCPAQLVCPTTIQNTCPACPEKICKKTTPYIIGIAVVSVLLFLFMILYISKLFK